MLDISRIIDLDRYPLDQPDCRKYRNLIECRRRRLAALLCYDREPGTVIGQSHIEDLERGLPRAS